MVFHPGNEPCLGRRSLYALDDVIVVCLKSNDTAVSMILERPDLCDRAAGGGAFWMTLLLVEMHGIFSDAFRETR